MSHLMSSAITPESSETKKVQKILEVKPSSRKEKKKMMKGEKQAPIPEGTVGENMSLRQRILALSLFPNPLPRMKIIHD